MDKIQIISAKSNKAKSNINEKKPLKLIIEGLVKLSMLKVIV
jgi:hypothetical protein